MSFYDFMGHKAETQNIIDKHCKDFDCNTAAEYLKKKGGVKAYIRSLGGVFTKWVDFSGKITTQEQLNEVGDYGIPVPDYVEENVSTKVVKIIQSYTGVVDKMVWRKF